VHGDDAYLIVGKNNNLDNCDYWCKAAGVKPIRHHGFRRLVEVIGAV
jgi:hypothetical protein